MLFEAFSLFCRCSCIIHSSFLSCAIPTAPCNSVIRKLNLNWTLCLPIEEPWDCFRDHGSCHALALWKTSSDLQMTMPPSPVVMVFAKSKLKVPTSPQVPRCLPFNEPPHPHAVSSIKKNFVFFARFTNFYQISAHLYVLKQLPL